MQNAPTLESPLPVVFGGIAGAISVGSRGDVDGHCRVFDIHSLGVQRSCFDG